MRCSDPWFVAKDVATCIEHSNATKMCDLCRDKDKIVVDVEELKTNDLLVLGNRGLTCISESGLYRILAKCNLPKCEPFENWVFDEVLPSIRKHFLTHRARLNCSRICSSEFVSLCDALTRGSSPKTCVIVW